ncbi:MAG: glycosyltransferase family 2 protein [Chloroflexi bacterium]|nr:glycosyltransferase family 2 protein [Chloroflexota bacterium]
MPSISVVLPAWNEEHNIATAIQQAVTALEGIGADYEIIVVDDGSRDGTARVVGELQTSPDTLQRIKCIGASHPQLRLVRHEVNRGYGQALRSGYAAAQKDLVLIHHADSQFDLTEIKRFLPLLAQADIICGYRAQRADPFMRKVNALGWNMVVRLLFGYLARDIDCGFKLFRREVLDHVHLTATRGAMIDTELLASARARGYRIAELPVTHLPRLGGQPTGAHLDVIITSFRELFAFRRRLSAELASERRR